ncbi:MAG: MauE/DoxX family redox-associated membrane protein, partial [Solirubrobacteraceae bacterium]
PRMMFVTVLATGLLATLAGVLAWAGASKLRHPSAASRTLTVPVGLDSGRVVRWLGAGEVALALAALVLPTRVSSLGLAALFAGFSAAHGLMRARAEHGGCGCFGEQPGRGPASPGRRVTLTGASALAAAGVAALAPRSPVALAGSDPGVAVAIGIGACLAAALWRSAFDGAMAARPGVIGERLVGSSALFLERRCSRRTALLRIAVAGSALCVAPLRYLLYPGSALAAISPSSCSGGLCTDGYTAFCCEINHGLNSCPGGTFPGGWWMCTDYRGSQLCSDQGVRYYVDCNRLPGHHFPGGCHCANGRCSERRVACNVFRYGQCNPQIPGTTEVVCRMVTCQNPGSIPGLHCSSSVSVDNAVCGHDVPCLKPRAIELAGAGGV